MSFFKLFSYTFPTHNFILIGRITLFKNSHIPLGKVQAAYDLIQKLWERKQLFYKELWAETYEKFWHFAATGSLPYTQEKLPELPEPDSRHQSNFYPIFYGAQMVGYLAQLIKLVSYKPF